RPSSPSVHETRGDACAPACSVDRSASPVCSPLIAAYGPVITGQGIEKSDAAPIAALRPPRPKFGGLYERAPRLVNATGVPALTGFKGTSLRMVVRCQIAVIAGSGRPAGDV